MSTHQSNLTAAEPSSVPRQHPSSSHSAGFGSPVPFYSRMKDNTGAESGSALGSQNPPRQPELQHPVKDTKMAAAHGLVRYHHLVTFLFYFILSFNELKPVYLVAFQRSQ